MTDTLRVRIAGEWRDVPEDTRGQPLEWGRPSSATVRQIESWRGRTVWLWLDGAWQAAHVESWEQEARRLRSDLAAVTLRLSLAEAALEDIADGAPYPQCLAARLGEGTLECGVETPCVACRAGRVVREKT